MERKSFEERMRSKMVFWPVIVAMVTTFSGAATFVWHYLHRDYASRDWIEYNAVEQQVDYLETRVEETKLFAEDSPTRQKQLDVLESRLKKTERELRKKERELGIEEESAD